MGHHYLSSPARLCRAFVILEVVQESCDCSCTATLRVMDDRQLNELPKQEPAVRELECVATEASSP